MIGLVAVSLPMCPVSAPVPSLGVRGSRGDEERSGICPKYLVTGPHPESPKYSGKKKLITSTKL